MTGVQQNKAVWVAVNAVTIAMGLGRNLPGVLGAIGGIAALLPALFLGTVGVVLGKVVNALASRTSAT
jgi:hypothetical protein